MYCPNCGAGEQSAKAYCKRCGDWLPEIRRPRASGGFGGVTPEQHISSTLIFSALSSLAALFSAIALYLTHSDGDAKWSVYLAAAFCVCIAAWQASSFIIGLKLRRRYKRGREEGSRVAGLGGERGRAALNAADTSQLVDARSVTEGPTEVFEQAPNVPRRVYEEDR